MNLLSDVLATTPFLHQIISLNKQNVENTPSYASILIPTGLKIKSSKHKSSTRKTSNANSKRAAPSTLQRSKKKSTRSFEKRTKREYQQFQKEQLPENNNEPSATVTVQNVQIENASIDTDLISEASFVTSTTTITTTTATTTTQNNQQQGSSDKRFFAAVAKGDHKTVEKMVQSENSLLAALSTPEMKLESVLKIKRVYRWSALHVASFLGHSEVVRVLVTAGMDPNILNSSGQSPLHLACLTGQLDAVTVLLSHGADVNIQNKLRYGQTPLHIAAIKNNAELVQLLVTEHHASVNQQCHNPRGGQGVMDLACHNGAEDVLKFLLENKAQINLQLTPDVISESFRHSARSRNLKLIDILLKYIPVKDWQNFPILVEAILGGNSVQAITELLYGESGTVSPVFRLNTTNYQSLNAIHAASIKADQDLLSLLLPLPPLQNVATDSDDFGRNAIHLLLMNAKDDGPNVAECIDMLSDYGVDVTAEMHKRDQTPLEIAAKRGFHEACTKLMQHKAQPTFQAVLAAIKLQRNDILRTLLQSKGVVNYKDNQDRTPLHFAVLSGNTTLVKSVLEFKPTLEARIKNKGEATALHLAVMKGFQEIAEALLQAGADPNARCLSVGGSTAYEIATFRGYKDIAQLLLTHGAKDAVKAQKDDEENTEAHDENSSELMKFTDKVPAEFQVNLDAISSHKEQQYASFHGQDMKEAVEVHKKKQKVSSDYSQQPWKTAKLFISSTFTDMHSEREYLIKQLIPQLKKECEQKRIHLIEVDLRWGATREDSQSGKIIDLCLQEVEKCQFFVGILGERYGWIPPTNLISDEVKNKYEITAGRSITHMEISVALEKKIPGIFLLRSEISPSVSADKRADFVESNPDVKKKLEVLRSTVTKSGLPAVSYSPTVNGLDADGKVKMTGFENFGASISQHFWNFVSKQFPTNEEPPDPLDLETSYHDVFIETRCKNFVGRHEYIDQMLEYTESNVTKPLLISGNYGAGKSSLMSQFAKSYQDRNSDSFVIRHFVGASAQSTNIRSALWRICAALKRRFELSEEIPDDFMRLCETLNSFLSEISKSTSVPILIVFDAVNQLDSSNKAHAMDWVPKDLPRGVKWVMSCLHGDILETLRTKKLPEIQVGDLSTQDRTEIVTQTLAQYKKRLDESQMNILLEKPGATSPLYLIIACEELRLFGIYEKLTDKIKSLADNVPDLLDQVLARIESQHSSDLVRKSLALLQCSRSGLFEAELLEILQVSSNQWGSLLVDLDFFLTKSQQGNLDFFHRQVAKAIQRRYLADAKVATETNAMLASYFMKLADPKGDRSWEGKSSRGFSELPYHALFGKKPDELTACLTDIMFIQMKSCFGYAYDLVNDCTRIDLPEAKSLLPAGSRERISAFKEFVTSNIFVLSTHPKLAIQQAVNSSNPLVVASGNARSAFGPLVQWLNKPADNLNGFLLSFMGHTSAVICCDMSHDHSLLVSGANYGAIHLWNVHTGCVDNVVVLTILGEKLASLNGHKQKIVGIAFGPADKFIVSASEDGEIRLWKRAVGTNFQEANVKNINGAIASMALSPAGNLVAVGLANGQVLVFSTDSWQQVSKVVEKDAVLALAWSPNSHHLATASKSIIKIWNHETGAQIHELSGHKQPVRSIKYTHDGKSIVSVSGDKSAKKWDAHNGTCWWTIKAHDDAITGCDVSVDSKKLVTCSFDKTVKLWNLESGTELNTFYGHSHFVNTCIFSKDGKKIISGAEDQSLRLYDAISSSSKKNNQGHTKVINDIKYCAKKHLFGSASWDKTLKLWNMKGELLRTITNHPKRVQALSFSPSGKTLVSASSDKTLKIFEVDSGRELNTLKGHTADVFACRYSHDGKYIISGSMDMTIKVWLADNGKCLATLTGHSGWVTCLAFAPYSRRFITGSRDAVIKIWDSQQGNQMGELTGHTKGILACEFTPDGKYIATGAEDHTVRLWDSYTCNQVHLMSGHTHEVIALAFLGNKFLLSGSADLTVRFWSVNSGEQLWTFFCQGQILSLDVAGPDTVLAGDGMGQVYMLKCNGMDQIAYDISALDVRVGKIVSVQRHPDADNMYLEQIDLGEDKPRQIISSLVKHVPLEKMMNRFVVVLCNIRPAMRRGIQSFGLVLAAANGDHSKVEPLQPPPNCKPGERIKWSGYNGAPEAQIDIQLYDMLAKNIYSDDQGVIMYKGTPFATSQGPVSVPSLFNCSVS